mmetsp:Transcript_827/g.1591  ORF Transcript_827/g.1591 Transcript_827/m.1591 type:complete len:274 (-) Transcript_827:553-1374(-)
MGQAIFLTRHQRCTGYASRTQANGHGPAEKAAQPASRRRIGNGDNEMRPSLPSGGWSVSRRCPKELFLLERAHGRHVARPIRRKQLLELRSRETSRCFLRRKLTQLVSLCEALQCLSRHLRCASQLWQESAARGVRVLAVQPPKGDAGRGSRGCAREASGQQQSWNARRGPRCWGLANHQRNALPPRPEVHRAGKELQTSLPDSTLRRRVVQMQPLLPLASAASRRCEGYHIHRADQWTAFGQVKEGLEKPCDLGMAAQEPRKAAVAKSCGSS